MQQCWENGKRERRLALRKPETGERILVEGEPVGLGRSQSLLVAYRRKKDSKSEQYQLNDWGSVPRVQDRTDLPK